MNIVQTHPAMTGGRRRANVVAHQQHVASDPASEPVAEPKPAPRKKLTVKPKA